METRSKRVLRSNSESDTKKQKIDYQKVIILLFLCTLLFTKLLLEEQEDDEWSSDSDEDGEDWSPDNKAICIIDKIFLGSEIAAKNLIELQEKGTKYPIPRLVNLCRNHSHLNSSRCYQTEVS